MLLKIDGLVIREQKVVDDRLITILTRQKGLVRAYARSARKMKNPSPATQILSFSSFVLYHSREKYIINESETIELFFELRSDIEKLALAQYFCELSLCLCPEEDDAEHYLRTVLNALHFLAKGSRPPLLLKSIVELRLLALAGYLPDLTACSKCGEYESEQTLFLYDEGKIMCKNCSNDSSGILLNKGAVTALRHIAYSEPDKLFSFTVSENSAAQLNTATENYTLCKTDRTFKSLDFYNSIKL